MSTNEFILAYFDVNMYRTEVIGFTLTNIKECEPLDPLAGILLFSEVTHNRSLNQWGFVISINSNEPTLVVNF